MFENYPVDERLQEAEQEHLRFGKVNGRDVTNFAMDLAVHLEDTFSIEFLYLRNAFTEEAVQLIRSSFETLLRALLAQPDARIGSLPMLPRRSRRCSRSRTTSCPRRPSRCWRSRSAGTPWCSPRRSPRCAPGTA